MKTKWIILLLVLGLLFFGLGCMGDSVAIEGIGAIVLSPGLIGLLEKIQPEEVQLLVEVIVLGCLLAVL